MNNLCGTNTGKNILKEVEKTIQYNLKWNLLRSVMTGGCKNMCRAEKGCFSKTHKACKDVKCLSLRLFIVLVIRRYFAESI